MTRFGAVPDIVPLPLSLPLTYMSAPSKPWKFEGEPVPLVTAHVAVKRVVPDTCVIVWVMWTPLLASNLEVTTYGSPAVPVPVRAGAWAWVNGALSTGAADGGEYRREGVLSANNAAVPSFMLEVLRPQNSGLATALKRACSEPAVFGVPETPTA